MDTKDLMLKRENAWDVFDDETQKAVFDFSEDYKAFLDAGKNRKRMCECGS